MRLCRETMNPRGYSLLPSAPPLLPSGSSVTQPSIELCYACRYILNDPLLVCGCGCRIPIHVSCYATLAYRHENCPVCSKTWGTSTSNSSVISMPFTEVIAENPMSQTECRPSCSTRWMVYSVSLLIIGMGGLFLFFYFIK